jgi:hypothetical protein
VHIVHCLISVIMNRWPEYDTAARALKQKILQHPDPLSFDPPPVFHETSGFLLVIDWDGEQILAGKQFPKPFGFALLNDILYVATWGGEDILSVRGNGCVFLKGMLFGVFRSCGKAEVGDAGGIVAG